MNRSMRISETWWLPVLIGTLLLLLALFALKLGNVEVNWRQVVNVLLQGSQRHPSDGMAYRIIWELRLPRVLLAIGVGAALSLCGAAFQAVLGNHLADPYLLGVSSGASLGAVTAMTLLPIAVGWVTPAAFVTAIMAVLMVLALARTKEGLSSERMILAGVAIGSVLTAVVSVLLIMTPNRMAEAMFWLMGGFSNRGWREVALFTPYFVGGVIMLVGMSRELNMMSVGEENAANLGVSVGLIKVVVLLTGSLLAAAAVSIAGVIGFVGLIVPHMARILVGPDHRRLLPVAGLGGALLLLAADTLARWVTMSGELPVGVLTAFLGGPFFLYLLRRGSYGR